MVHRYNTRYQAKLNKKIMPALDSDEEENKPVEKKEEPREKLGGLFQRVYENMKDPSHWLNQSSNRIYHSDTSLLKLLIGEACDEKDMFKRIFKAIRLFHYLEFKPNLMKTNSYFRKTVYEKTIEFSNDADVRIEKYQDNEYLCKAFEYLKESCLSVQKVINTF
jgi:hypothetical protein